MQRGLEIVWVKWGGGELAELSQNGEKFGRWVRVEWDGVVGVE